MEYDIGHTLALSDTTVVVENEELADSLLI